MTYALLCTQGSKNSKKIIYKVLKRTVESNDIFQFTI